MQKNQENVRVMRVKEASAYLGIKPSTFWRWCQHGKLPKGIRLSTRCTVWKREDLETFLKQQEGRA